MTLTNNQLKSSTVYGTFQNSDYTPSGGSAVNANATFDRNINVTGDILIGKETGTTGSYVDTGGNIKFNLNGTSYTISTTILSYLSTLSSNTQTQLNTLSSNFSNYVLTSSLATTLSSYVTNSSLTTTLSSYVTNSSLTTSLSSYVTNSSLTSTLTSYVLSTDLTTTLSSYLTSSSASSTYAPKNNATFIGTTTISTPVLTDNLTLNSTSYTLPTSGQLGYSNLLILASDVTLSTGVTTTVITLSLTPGIYLCIGNICFYSGSGTTTYNTLSVSINTGTSLDQIYQTRRDYNTSSFPASTSTLNRLQISRVISATSNTNVNLLAQSNFTTTGSFAVASNKTQLYYVRIA